MMDDFFEEGKIEDENEAKENQNGSGEEEGKEGNSEEVEKTEEEREIEREKESISLKTEMARMKEEMKKSNKKLDAFEEEKTARALQKETIIEDVSFIDEKDFDEISSNPAELNNILNKVYKQGIENARKEMDNKSQKLLLAIPEIVKHNIEVSHSLRIMSEKFYAENEELIPYKSAVAVGFEEIQGKEPNLGYDEILKKLAPALKKKLNLAKKVKKSPVLPEVGNQKRGGFGSKNPNTDELLNEISEMHKALEN